MRIPRIASTTTSSMRVNPLLLGLRKTKGPSNRTHALPALGRPHCSNLKIPKSSWVKTSTLARAARFCRCPVELGAGKLHQERPRGVGGDVVGESCRVGKVHGVCGDPV